jgi:hypothetical protein
MYVDDASLILSERTAASVPTPAAGTVTLFVDIANGHVSQKDDAGVVTDLTLTGGGGGGSPSGATGDIQFNNAGAFGSSPGFEYLTSTLVLADADPGIELLGIVNEPAAPAAGRLRLYAKDLAGRILPKFKTPSGLDSPLQTAIWQENFCMWTMTTATAGVWLGTTGGTTNGTYSTLVPNPAGALCESYKRGRWSNVVTTLNQVLGQRNTEALWYRGNAASKGGFFFYCKFGFGVWTNGSRLFVGLSAAVNTTTACPVISADPSSVNNTVGFCIDAADNGAISFLTRGTVATKAATGQTVATTTGFEAFIFCPPNSASIKYRLVNINTGVVVTGEATLNLPAQTTLMMASCAASNAALTTANATQIECAKIYISQDF